MKTKRTGSEVIGAQDTMKMALTNMCRYELHLHSDLSFDLSLGLNRYAIYNACQINEVNKRYG